MQRNTFTPVAPKFRVKASLRDSPPERRLMIPTPLIGAIATLIATGATLGVTHWESRHTPVASCMDPKIWDTVISCDLKQRVVASIMLGNCHFPKEDVENILRLTSTLDHGCPAPITPVLPQAPPVLVTHYRLAAELRTRSLRETLRDADDYAMSNSPAQLEASLDLYLDVLNGLSPTAKKDLDPETVREFHTAMEKHDTKQAVKQLSSALRRISQEPDSKEKKQ